MGVSLTDSVVALLLLFGASALARRLLMRDGSSPIASGGIVMAGGVFAIAALERLSFPEIIPRLVTLFLLVVWGFIAFSYAGSGFSGALAESLRRPANVFVVGTWVAGSAVLGRALIEVLPAWSALALALWMVAAALWLWYLRLLIPAFLRVWSSPGEHDANGSVLLSAVATQSLVVAGDMVLPGGMPGWTAAALIVLGCLFYAAGLVLLSRRYLLRADWTLADDWDDTNCILHGAMSITGLAVVQSQAVPGSWAVAAWLWAATMFVLVEAVEAARLVVRAKSYGWKTGLLSYYVSQWARIFTFGMFYVFTLELHRSPLAPAWAAGLMDAIVGYGFYVVFAAILAQSALFLADSLARGPRPFS